MTDVPGVLRDKVSGVGAGAWVWDMALALASWLADWVSVGGDRPIQKG